MSSVGHRERPPGRQYGPAGDRWPERDCVAFLTPVNGVTAIVEEADGVLALAGRAGNERAFAALMRCRKLVAFFFSMPF